MNDQWSVDETTAVYTHQGMDMSAMPPRVHEASPLGRVFNPVFQFGPIGSRGDTLYYSPKCGGIVTTGCFLGTLFEFELAVVKAHGDSAHGRAYEALIACLKALPEGYPVVSGLIEAAQGAGADRPFLHQTSHG